MVASRFYICLLRANDRRTNRIPGVWRVRIFKFLAVPFQMPLVNLNGPLLVCIAAMSMLEIHMTSLKAWMMCNVIKDCLKVIWIDRTIRIKTDNWGSFIDKRYTDRAALVPCKTDSKFLWIRPAICNMIQPSQRQRRFEFIEPIQRRQIVPVVHRSALIHVDDNQNLIANLPGCLQTLQRLWKRFKFIAARNRNHCPVLILQ